MAVAERGSDAMRQYLNEIGQHELLTAEDERRLGKLIKDGQVAARQLEAGNVVSPTSKR